MTTVETFRTLTNRALERDADVHRAALSELVERRDERAVPRLIGVKMKDAIVNDWEIRVSRGTSGLTPPPLQSQAQPAVFSYRIENANSGKVADVYDVSTADGANVVQWP